MKHSKSSYKRQVIVAKIAFRERLEALGFDCYDAYLYSDHWSNFKSSWRHNNHGLGCVLCGDKNIQLHHHTYERLGSELLTDVTPLCDSHHKQVHDHLDIFHGDVSRTGEVITNIKAGRRTVQDWTGSQSKPKHKKFPPDPKPTIATKTQRRAYAKKLVNQLKKFRQRFPTLSIWLDAARWLNAGSLYSTLEAKRDLVKQMARSKPTDERPGWLKRFKPSTIPLANIPSMPLNIQSTREAWRTRLSNLRQVV